MFTLFGYWWRQVTNSHHCPKRLKSNCVLSEVKLLYIYVYSS